MSNYKIWTWTWRRWIPYLMGVLVLVFIFNSLAIPALPASKYLAVQGRAKREAQWLAGAASNAIEAGAKLPAGSAEDIVRVLVIEGYTTPRSSRDKAHRLTEQEINEAIENYSDALAHHLGLQEGRLIYLDENQTPWPPAPQEPFDWPPVLRIIKITLALLSWGLVIFLCREKILE